MLFKCVLIYFVQSKLNLEFVMKSKSKGSEKEDKQTMITQSQMKFGEYQLHVLIEATSALSLDYQQDINPMIQIKAFGQTSHSSIKKKIGVQQTSWGQHYYFYKKFDNMVAIANQRLTISVYNHNIIASNSLIGSYDIDIVRVYREVNHKMQHYWFGLSNIQRNFNEITGYVKVSLSIIGEGQNMQQLKMEPIASIGAQRKILLPPTIQRKSYQVILELLRGIDIVPIDGKTVDSYVGLQFGQIFQVSKPIAKKCNPEYNQRILLPMSTPAAISSLAIRLNDFNFIQKGQVLGSKLVLIDDLLDNKGIKGQKFGQSHLAKSIDIKPSDLQWFNFYGPQPKAKNSQKKNIQQFFPQTASYYVGSLEMRIAVQETGFAEKKTEPIQKQYIADLRQVYPAHKLYYRITAAITAGISFYNKNKSYKIQVSVGPNSIQTEYASAKNGFCVWADELAFSTAVYSNQVVPDIFIYLVDHKGVRVCYSRHKASDIAYKPILQNKWIYLTPDLGIVDYKFQQAGYIQLGLKMQRNNTARAQSSTPLHKKVFAHCNKVNTQSCRIYIQLINAHSLIPLDQQGSSDPFFIFTFMNQQVSSSIKYQTLNPNYLQTLVISTDIPSDLKQCPPLIVSAYDKDKMSTQLIGSVYLDISTLVDQKALTFDNKQPIAKQFQLQQNRVACGYFNASFRMTRNTSIIPPQIKFKCKRYKFSLIVLGLRNLKSTSFIQIKRPHIQFDFKALDKFHQQNKQLKAITLKIAQSGNLDQQDKYGSTRQNAMTEVFYLPENQQYWPVISAKVKNTVINKLYDQTLGYFAINLKAAYKQSKQIKKIISQKKQCPMNPHCAIKHKSSRLKNISDSTIHSLRSLIMRAINYQWQVLDKDIPLNKLEEGKKGQKLFEGSIVLFPNYVKIYGDQGIIANPQYYGSNKLNKDLKRKKVKKNQEDDLKKLVDLKQNRSFKYIQAHESRIIQNQHYMSIGHDNNETRGKSLDQRQKHYRYVLKTSFQEYVLQAFGFPLSMINQQQIRRGRYNTDSNSLINTLAQKVSNQDMQCGIFKGNIIFVQMDKADEKVNQRFLKQEKKIIQRALIRTKVVMYLYIIDARNLPTKDLFSESDSYLIIKTQRQSVNLQSMYIEDDNNPQYFHKVRMELQLPFDAIVQVQVWDYDALKVDQLIGTVTIDVQNRIQASLPSETWNNPIETHNVKIPTSKIPQGILRFWLDLVPVDKIGLYRQFDIKPKQAANFQVRVIIWNCTGIPNHDVQGMNDLYVVCAFSDQMQETDVHYRTVTGQGYFNWRMKFPVKMPLKNYEMAFRVYDKDIFSSNDFIASCSFSIEEYIREAFQTDSSTRLFLGKKDLSKNSDVKTGKSRSVNGSKRYDRFEIQLVNKNEKSGQSYKQKNKLKTIGKVQVSIEILTEKQAKKRPAGSGRGDPNQNPYLPEPKSRNPFSLNPFQSLGFVLGSRSFKIKVALITTLILVVLIGLYFLLSYAGSAAAVQQCTNTATTTATTTTQAQPPQ